MRPRSSSILRIGRALAFAPALATALGGCRAEGPGGDEAGARPIEFVVTNDADTLDPRYAVDAVGLRATRLLHAGLTRLDPETLAPVPYLAEGIRFLDPLTARIELRPGVRFHSGAPLTARDVVATLDAFASPAVGSRHARVVEAIAESRAEGDRAVIVRLKRPHATLLTDLELPILRADQALGPPRPDGGLDGLGPFVLEHLARGAIALAPAPAPPPTIDAPRHRVVVRTVHDENARALRLLAGRSDVAQNVLAPALLPTFGDAVVSRPGANLTYLLLRVDRGPLADVTVRRALAAAIDRDAIARTLLKGRAQTAATILPPMHWSHTDRPPMPFDPAGARDALAPRGLHLTLLTSTDRSRGTLARFVAQQLGDAGAAIDVRPLELGTMLARLNAGDFDMALLQMPELTEPNVLGVFLHGGQIPPAGANRGRVRDPELDALLDEGATVSDRAARRAIYAAVEARLRDRLYILPLWHEDQVAVVSPRARGFVPSAEGRWLSLATLP